MPTIFLHGLGQNPAVWDKTLAHLPQEPSPFCPDLSAFLTDEPASYDTLYRNFKQYCDRFQEPLSFCGLSLGAVLALNYAIDYPSKVSSMVLAAPQYDMPKLLLKIQSLIFRFLPDTAFADIGLKKADFLSLTASMAHLNFTERLKRVVCPVTVICGEKDSVNRKAAEKLAAQLPHAKFISVPDAGHEINADAPERFAELLLQNFSSCEQ